MTRSASAGQEVSRLRFWVPGILLVLLGVTFDQWTKLLAVQYLKGSQGIPLLPTIFHLEYVENRGAAFGIFAGRISFFLLVTILISLGIVWALARMPRSRHYLLLNRILFLLLAGALGNLIDRVRLGYVVDFFYFCLIDFPVFNMADIYAVISCILLAVLAFTVYQEEDDFDFLFPSRKDPKNGNS